MALHDNPTPPSEHEDRAMKMMAQVRELARTIEGFDFAVKGRRAKIATASTLPEDFFQYMAVAIDTYPEVAVVAGMTGQAVRSTIAATNAYKGVVKDMLIQARGLDDTIAEHRAAVGSRLLRAYDVAKRLDRDGAAKIPHLPDMKIALGRGRSKGEKTAAAQRKRAATDGTPPAPAAAGQGK